MGKGSDIRRDIASARPCRLCGAPVFVVRVNYRVVPDSLHDWEGEALDLVSMPTRFSMVLDREPADGGYYIINSEPNGEWASQGFVAYDPELSLDAPRWGYIRYRGHDCPKSSSKMERAHGNRTFLAGRLYRPDDVDVNAAVGGGA